MSQRKITINIPALARVEGEGALEVDIQDAAITRLQLRIYEPPRYFEKFLQGRDYHEVPDIVARICGICPVAYQMSAVQALESIFRVTIPTTLQNMRRAMYCGEWLQSHSLHIHMLAAPDYLGFDSITGMAAQYPEIVQRGLRLQALGNRLIELFGARSVHPVGVSAGGFHHIPAKEKITALVQQLESSLVDAEALIAWTAALALPDEQQDFTCVALRHEHHYPMNHGRLVSNRGMDIDMAEFENHFTEQQVPHSTALHCLLADRPYLVGPLARLNLNLDRLSPRVQQAMARSDIRFPSNNMFHSIVARAIEILIAIEEAIRCLTSIDTTAAPNQTVTTRAGIGFGCSEAPRGILWHRYAVDEQGIIRQARIVPPTSQNQARIEQDLFASLTQFGLDQSEAALRLQGEKVIRNYDPCISCATHFLTLNLKRDTPAHPTKKPRPVKGGLCILGMGSPSGLDTLGWQVIDYLQTHPDKPRDIQCVSLDRPGTQLMEYLQNDARLILVDAMDIDTDQTGPIHLRGSELTRPSRPLSSHGLGIMETLALADSLKFATDKLDIFGLAMPANKTDWDQTEIARLGQTIIEYIKLQS